jgi:hypothetical protein
MWTIPDFMILEAERAHTGFFLPHFLLLNAQRPHSRQCRLIREERRHRGIRRSVLSVAKPQSVGLAERLFIAVIVWVNDEGDFGERKSNSNVKVGIGHGGSFSRNGDLHPIGRGPEGL